MSLYSYTAELLEKDGPQPPSQFSQVKISRCVHWKGLLPTDVSIVTARLLRLPRLQNWLSNRRRWIETLNVVSSLLFRVQYKNEHPNQSLKFKTHNVVSSVLWRVHYKHETPNQSLKFKTLNVVCSMCSQVQWNHETPNQSLNCWTLGKRRRLWVLLQSKRICITPMAEAPLPFLPYYYISVPNASHPVFTYSRWAQ